MSSADPEPTVTREPFGQMPDGSPVSLYTLGAKEGLRVAITDFGGAIVALWAPDREGRMADVVLGYDSLEGYLSGKSYFGGIIGRFGNRIAEGRFQIDGQTFCL